MEELRVIDAYYQSSARYYFRAQAEVEALFCAGEKFSLLGSCIGHYQCAERCPVLAFARR